MTRSLRSEIMRWSVVLWIAVSTIYLSVCSFLIFGDDRFQLNVGAIKTTGRAGLWVTLAPAVVGWVALLLVALGRRAGPVFAGSYCGVWILALLGVLPSIWNARQSFCTSTMCIRTPWIARLLVFALMTPFVLGALWARNEFARQGPGRNAGRSIGYGTAR